MNINESFVFHFSRNIDSSLVDYSVLCLQSTIIRIILHLTIQLFYKHLILLQASVLQQIIVFIQGQVSGSQASLQSQGTTFSGNNDYSIRHLQYSTCIDSAQKRCRSDHILYIIPVQKIQRSLRCSTFVGGKIQFLHLPFPIFSLVHIQLI